MRKTGICLLAILFVMPSHLALGQRNFSAMSFPLDRVLPEMTVSVLRYQPPARSGTAPESLRGLFKKDTVVSYVIPGNKPSESAALETHKSAKSWKRLSHVIFARAMNPGELDQLINWVEQHQIMSPVVIDRNIQLAMGIGAVRVPSFTIVDKKAVLKVKKFGYLGEKFEDGRTLTTVLADIEKGKAIPVSDGPVKENTKNLIGKPAPSLSLKPSKLSTTRIPLAIGPNPRTKPALVVVWIATCPHCQREIPKVAKWYKKNKDKVDLATVTRTEDPQLGRRTEEYLKSKDLQWLPVYEGTQEVNTKLKVAGVPAWIMVGRSGKVVAGFVGEDGNIERSLDEALKNALVR